MNPNYNSTASFYDSLSRVLFGNALINAQVYLLKFIYPGSKILIVGGGTGLILEQISKLHPAGLNITYVEIAKKMMRKARRRFTGANKVDFITDDIKNLVSAEKYDVVITPFLFDNFSEQHAEQLFNHIHSLIKPTGTWLYCDFQLTGKWWQKALLKLMLLFFRILTKVEANELPGMQKIFAARNYKAINSETFFGDFVISIAYILPIKN